MKIRVNFDESPWDFVMMMESYPDLVDAFLWENQTQDITGGI